MKKLLVLTSFIFFSYAGFSQEIGVRFGDVLGNDIAMDAIFNSGKFHRLHADFSFGSDFGLEILWDFWYKPFGGEAFHYYLGMGPSMLFGDDFFLGFSGELGLEYHFKSVPIAVGADWRPTFFVVNDDSFEAGGYGVNARFVF
jgi:hypothetical protein